MSQTLQSVLCITTNKYLVRVLVVLLHACFSVVSPIPFLLAAIFFSVHPYIGSTTVLPDILYTRHMFNIKRGEPPLRCLPWPSCLEIVAQRTRNPKPLVA